MYKVTQRDEVTFNGCKIVDVTDNIGLKKFSNFQLQLKFVK